MCDCEFDCPADESRRDFIRGTLTAAFGLIAINWLEGIMVAVAVVVMAVRELGWVI